MERAEPTKLIIRMIYIAALIIIVIGIVYYRSLAVLPFAFGVALTSGLNVFKIKLLERAVNKTLDIEDKSSGGNYIRLQYLLRYFMTGVVLVVVGIIHTYTTPPTVFSSREIYFAFWRILLGSNGSEALLNAPAISVWGALAGIFTMQISVILVRFKKFEHDEIKSPDEESPAQKDNEESSHSNEIDSVQALNNSDNSAHEDDET